MKGEFIVFGISLLWILFCMRFWFLIDRENVIQRRLIAIGAGLGGGLIYMLGSMVLPVLREAEQPTTPATEMHPSPTIRILPK